MLHKVATVNEVPAGKMKQVRVVGQAVLLANVDGEFFAIGDTCTHASCRLSTGFLDGNAVFCPCHGSQFDVTSGEVLGPPAPAPEPTYKVVIQGGDVYIEV